MNPLTFAEDTQDALPLHAVAKETLADWRDGLEPAARAWAESAGFDARPGAVLLLPGADGALAGAAVGMGDSATADRRRFTLAAARAALPARSFELTRAPGTAPLDGPALAEAALGWLFAGYRFERYTKPSEKPSAALVAPEGVDAARLEAIAAGEALTRDLINTPASDMGPAELEEAARNLATRFGAGIEVTEGDALLDANFPMIHAVGRAAATHRQPRLIEMTWGNEGPALTLVGKGVCFDTGGLDIKPAAAMGLMKKDMGGAANVLGLAHDIMALELPLRLRVLIPAVENAIGSDAFRPQDILTSRKGLSVEINNTDAEGRLVLADALALADEASPDLIVSMATLTGAARVALGADIAPFFANMPGDAAALREAAARAADPVWELPFHAPYEPLIEPGIADLDNAPSGGFAGAITAALFLRRFVTATPRYMHFDIYAWARSAAPGRTKGGFGQGSRALLEALPQMLSL